MAGDAQAQILLSDLIARALKAGADEADALMLESISVSASQRLGTPEKVERSESTDIGLRVFKGKRQAVVSSTDRSAQALAELVERVTAMAAAVPEDPCCGLAGADELARELPELDICDEAEPGIEALVDRARALEGAALAVPGVTNSEGAEADWVRTVITMAASNGFTGSYAVSRHALIVSVLAGEGTEMERDYEYLSTVHGEDLEDTEVLGRRAGERAVRRLGPRKVATAKAPMIFDPRVAGGLVSHLAAAINGATIARGTSFLKDKMNERIFPYAITIVDDPYRKRGLRSHPFDGEGVACRRRNIIDEGVLTSWLLDLRSARQLGLETTGHAGRGTSSPPSPRANNLYLEAGHVTARELMAEINNGFYVTELLGMGINMVTGDYSRGASGFWIEHGEIIHPVSEVTIAGNLIDMFAHISAANDLEFRYGTDAPTLRLEGMTVAGH